MRILIVSDESRPGRGGTAELVAGLTGRLAAAKHLVEVVGPGGEWELDPGARVQEAARGLHPQAIHLMTEGRYGRAARAFCRLRGFPYTSYLSSLPDEKSAPGLLAGLSAYRKRRFHKGAARILVPSPRLKARAIAVGIPGAYVWAPAMRPTAFRMRVAAGDERFEPGEPSLSEIWRDYAERFVKLLVPFEYYEPGPPFMPERGAMELYAEFLPMMFVRMG